MSDTSTTIDPKLTELLDAMNARMLVHRVELTGTLSDGHEDERFNGLPLVNIVLREDYRFMFPSSEAYYHRADAHGDTPFLSSDQEQATDDAMFWYDAWTAQDQRIAAQYVVDPAKAQALLDYITARNDQVYTDAERAQDLADAHAGL